MNQLRCEFLRAGRVESVHRVSLAALERGKPVLVRGRVDDPVFMRSCAKPFQGLSVVESGAADAYGFSTEEIAVICGSHLGETEHVRAVQSILKKSGLKSDTLQCGVHPPSGGKALRDLTKAGKEPTVLHNNCSGKHSGMLAAARFLRASLETYLRPGHPLQKANLRNLSRFSGVPAEKIGLGVDGCSAPTFAVPLRAMARALASFCETPGTPQRVRDAMMARPQMVGRPCSTIMSSAPGRILAKVGAEGVYVCGFPGRDAGLALKVEDGGTRAFLPVLHAVIRRLGWLEKADLGGLSKAAPAVLRNHAGLAVGEVRVVF
ncbi:MAG: asparaginase [Planctomycetaceae bacterium]|nr:asparaginase [Planctomycetaceae bacterium]